MQSYAALVGAYSTVLATNALEGATPILCSKPVLNRLHFLRLAIARLRSFPPMRTLCRTAALRHCADSPLSRTYEVGPFAVTECC